MCFMKKIFTKNNNNKEDSTDLFVTPKLTLPYEFLLTL